MEDEINGIKSDNIENPVIDYKLIEEESANKINSYSNGNTMNNAVKKEVAKMDSDKILEKYLERLESDRKDSEQRTREDMKSSEARLYEDRKMSEQRLTTMYDATQTVIKEMNTKLDKVSETSVATTRWVIGLVISAILSLFGVSISFILRMWNP